MVSQGSVERHSGLLRAWHLAILRFALTRENADRLGVLAVANEIDRLDGQRENEPGFSFFRRTSAELCAALLERGKGDAVLDRYLEGIDDARLRRALAAALEVAPCKTQLARRRPGLTRDLWRGLPSRAVRQP